MALSLASLTRWWVLGFARKTSCSEPREGTQLSLALEQLQQNAERDLLLRNEYPFEYGLARAYDTFDPSRRRSVVKRDTVSIRSESVDKYVPGSQKGIEIWLNVVNF